MLNITSNSNGFTVEAINNIYYPDNGTLTFGPNQVIMILDDVSEMVTFKDNANRRTLFSGILGQISIDGVVVTRDNIIEKFAEVATSQGGGGDMSNYYTKAQSDAKYATKTEVGEYFDNAAYDSQEKKINFYHGDAVVAYVDATDFIKDGMVSNVTITEGNLVITFNVDAGKQDIVIPLSSIFNPANYYTKSEIDGMIPVVPTNVSAFTNDAGYLTQHQSLDDYYTKTEVDADLAAKQDTLTAGANITIENNVISAQGGGTAQVQSDWNQSDSAAVDFIKNKPTIPTVPTNVSAFNNDAGYLTQHQSLAGYATETWVGEQGYAESADLATVATTGDYDDLTNKPTIPTVPTDVSAFNNDAGYLTQHQSLAGYATETWVGQQGYLTTQAQADWNESDSSAADFIKNKPTIPAAQIQSDWNQSDSSAVDFIKNKPTIPSLTGYATESWVETNYYNKTAIDGMIGNIQTILESI